MTAPAPLTDDELAAMRKRLRHRATCQAQPWNDERPCTCNSADDFDRLISDLRAARGEEAATWASDRWSTLVAERDALIAEVERLREWHASFATAIEAYRAAWPVPAAAIPATNAINALVNAYDDLEPHQGIESGDQAP